MNAGSFNIITDDQQRILLCLRHDKDLWNLPGGRVELDESPWDAAIREAKEEINVEVKIQRLQGIYHKPKNNELVFQFISEIITGVPALSDEVKEVKYFTFNEIPANTAPLQFERIKLFYLDSTKINLITH